MQTVQTPELTPEQVNQAVNAIIEVLGSPQSDLQQLALSAFHRGDYQTVKRLAATNLSDCYLETERMLPPHRNGWR
ncbi:hypothetical protein BZZ01_15050 [Nostocales cyanobacterium HT-58-2]|nr:hypothetical protein BZZ01_15050 [Nostocales cyanobacterium HT-58-2]